MDHSLRAYLEQRSTKELDGILDYVVHNYMYNPEDTVKIILEILEEREENIKVEITPQMRALWAEILQQKQK